ncbi:MAG: alanyl-tRNA editing protein [Sedimenticola sp.]|nr:alanyl-tRNA editing protein [Sedimenticola sp.]
MVEKIFWDDPYRSRLSARVTGVSGETITLDRSIFFAFSGGQESDHGRIGGQPVLEARKQGREILYRLPPDHDLKPGLAVEVEIDWPRRYRLMQLHFACEITLELICQALPGIERIGAHIAADKARIDFLHQDSLAPLLVGIENAVNRMVQDDLPIITGFSDSALERRFWEIDGFARVPCGGTHLKRTGEIGRVHLKRKNPGRGKERVEVRIDDGASREAATHDDH